MRPWHPEDTAGLWLSHAWPSIQGPHQGPDNPPLSPQRVLTCPVSAVFTVEGSTHPAGQEHEVQGGG